MLLYVAELLTEYISGFNVFTYITLRAIMGALTALVISLFMGPIMIRRLSLLQIGQTVREDGPDTHYPKTGTPTMGGALILVAILSSTLLWADLRSEYVWIVVAVTLAFGLIGFADDFQKLVLRDPKGMSAGTKFFWQSLTACAVAVILFLLADQPYETALLIPFLKGAMVPLGALSMVLTFLVIVGTSNAVNLTDGLDGLAIMPTVLVGGALGIFGYAAGNAIFSGYLNIPYIAGAGEMMVFCSAMAGAGLGFLWFNTYPAQVFMGDIGALSLGAALGTVAVIVRQELVLAIMGGLFVIETLSVIISGCLVQDDRAARVFRMAPLHHHYELKGWAETESDRTLLDHHRDPRSGRTLELKVTLMVYARNGHQRRNRTIFPSSPSVLVMGMGATGASCARYFAAQGIGAEFVDTRSRAAGGRGDRRTPMPDARLHTGGQLGELPASTIRTIVIVTPGFDLNSPLICAGRDRGVEILSDIDLFVAQCRAPIVGVTGSNGKSTVTSMLGTVLPTVGLSTAIGGNLGTPALDLLDEQKDVYVLELSSFQLERSQPVPAAVSP